LTTHAAIRIIRRAVGARFAPRRDQIVARHAAVGIQHLADVAFVVPRVVINRRAAVGAALSSDETRGAPHVDTAEIAIAIEATNDLIAIIEEEVAIAAAHLLPAAQAIAAVNSTKRRCTTRSRETRHVVFFIVCESVTLVCRGITIPIISELRTAARCLLVVGVEGSCASFPRCRIAHRIVAELVVARRVSSTRFVQQLVFVVVAVVGCADEEVCHLQLLSPTTFGTLRSNGNAPIDSRSFQ